MTPPKAGSVAAAEASEPVLEFAAAKSMSYRRRTAWALGLVAGGFALQVATLSPWPGLPLLLAALVISWVAGFDARLDRRAFAAGGAWTTVPFEKVEEVVRLDAHMRRWDSSAIDISSGAGVATWLLLAVCVAVAAIVTADAAGDDAALIVGVDGAVLLLCQWFSGMRSVHRQPDLVRKAEHLAEVVASLRDDVARVGDLRGQLRMSGGAASVPLDARFSVTKPGEPGAFLCLQGQVVLNRVQGTPYPYFYAVVVAKRRSGLVALAGGETPPAGVVIEPGTEGDVEIAVVRQATTKTSGYHTKPAKSREILATALRLAERFLVVAPPPSA